MIQKQTYKQYKIIIIYHFVLYTLSKLNVMEFILLSSHVLNESRSQKLNLVPKTEPQWIVRNIIPEISEQLNLHVFDCYWF